MVDLQRLSGVPDPPLDLVLREVPERRAEREGQVVEHRHHRVQGVLLEDKRDVPVGGGQIVHRLTIEQHPPLVLPLQSGDHTQRGGLARSGGAQQHEELAVFDRERDVLQGGHPREMLGDMA